MQWDYEWQPKWLLSPQDILNFMFINVERGGTTHEILLARTDEPRKYQITLANKA